MIFENTVKEDDKNPHEEKVATKGLILCIHP